MFPPLLVLRLPKLLTARSALPSPLKSAAMTCSGVGPVVYCPPVWKALPPGLRIEMVTPAPPVRIAMSPPLASDAAAIG